VSQTSTIVVALRSDEDLGLVLQPAERLAVHDAASVAGVRGAKRAGLHGMFAPTRIARALRPTRETRLQFIGGYMDSPSYLVVHRFTGPVDAALSGV
jgi:hypothetical protein